MPNETDTRRRVTYPPQGGNPEIATAVGGFTSRDLIPQDAYALPMHRNPNDPPNTNYGDPYASRRHLPRYIGFPSKYPQVLPVETPTARGIVSALIQPWLLPMPDPIRLPPAPRGGGRVNKPADPPPADDKKQEETKTTTTPATPAATPTPYSYFGVEGISSTGMDPYSDPRVPTATDPDLTMQDPNRPIGVNERAAIAQDAVNDMLSRYLNSGDGEWNLPLFGGRNRNRGDMVQYQPTVNLGPGSNPAEDLTGYGATIQAMEQGNLNRNAYMRDLAERQRLAMQARLNGTYDRVLAEQRGY